MHNNIFNIYAEYTILEQNKINNEPMNKHNNISIPQLGSINK